jgi:glycosyltransferase involved in cell wall biosynthesis
VDQEKERNILISVCMVTYNHEKWISQAIEGVLMQITKFRIELVIGDDCSKDRTKEIINTYYKKYPEIIRPYFNKENYGLSVNFSQLLNCCNGDYIAICEGDDFWTDRDKLQKQVEFLDSNPEFILTSHNFSKLFESTSTEVHSHKYYSDFNYNQKRFLKEWVTQPVTCVFKKIFHDYTLFNKEEDSFCDVILFYELLKHGNGFFMHDDMATFRVHQKALSSGLSRWQWFRNHVIMFDYLFKYNKQDVYLQRISRNYCLSLFVLELQYPAEKHDFKPLKEYFKRRPGWSEKIVTSILKIPYYLFRHYMLLRIKSIFNYGK